MRRLLNLVFLLVIILTRCKQAIKDVHLNKNKPDDYSVRIKVPDEWIEKLHRFDYSRNTQPLLTEFETIIKPDTIHNPHAQHVDEGYGRVLNPIFTDLDGKPGEEVVCLLGWDYSCPDLCVFKKVDGSWYLIYLEPIDTFYSAPSLSIAGNFSKNKVFYYSHVTNHGTGVFRSDYVFYKIIDGKVYKCLEQVGEANFENVGPYLSQAVKTNFVFSGDDSDRLDVTYDYDFYRSVPNRNKNQDDEQVSIIRESSPVSYKWDDRSKTYQLDIPGYQNKVDDLTGEKIACFGELNDTAFVKAFKKQLDIVEASGTSQQKRALREYLGHLNERKN